MSSTLLSLCISALFSWWVWSLKQDLANIHLQAAGQSDDGLADEPPAGHPPHHHSPVMTSKRAPVTNSTPVHIALAPSNKRRRPDGVAVWTIN
jgi:hypothetical protein